MHYSIFHIISLLLLASIQSSTAPDHLISHIIAPNERRMPTLKELAAAAFVRAFDPTNTTYDIEQLKKIIPKQLDLDIASCEILINTLHKEQADILEAINNAQPIKLSDTEISGQIEISPDSSYICYIAQKRHRNHTFNWPPDTLVLLHLPTQTQTLITHNQLGYSASPSTCCYPEPLFGADSTSLFFEGVRPMSYTPIYRYHIPSKTLSVLTEIPAKQATLKYIDPDGTKVVVAYGLVA